MNSKPLTDRIWKAFDDPFSRNCISHHNIVIDPARSQKLLQGNQSHQKNLIKTFSVPEASSASSLNDSTFLSFHLKV